MELLQMYLFRGNITMIYTAKTLDQTIAQFQSTTIAKESQFCINDMQESENNTPLLIRAGRGDCVDDHVHSN